MEVQELPITPSTSSLRSHKIILKNLEAAVVYLDAILVQLQMCRDELHNFHFTFNDERATGCKMRAAESYSIDVVKGTTLFRDTADLLNESSGQISEMLASVVEALKRDRRPRALFLPVLYLPPIKKRGPTEEEKGTRTKNLLLDLLAVLVARMILRLVYIIRKALLVFEFSYGSALATHSLLYTFIILFFAQC